MTIKLYDLAGASPDILFSPFSWRIRMALLHKGLDFEVIPWRFSDRSATADSGHATIPVIQDGERWVGDSWEIARYLDATYPERPALMADAAAQAHARLIMALCSTLVFPAVIPIAVYQAYQALDERCKPYFRESREAMFGTSLEQLNADPESGRAALSAALKPFAEVLTACPFINGEQPAYADYVLFGVLKWIDIVSHYDALEAGAVRDWFERLGALYGGHAGKVATVRDLPRATRSA